MKNLFSMIKFTVLCFLLFSVIYPLVITGIAQFSPNKGKGESIEIDHRAIGFKKIGQLFTKSTYFWGRRSAANYNAAGGSGSIKGLAILII